MTGLTQPDCERRSPGEGPILPEQIRGHLGRMLAAAYRPSDATRTDCGLFGDLLARLDRVLVEAGDAREVAFRADLLAVLPALRRFAVSLTHDGAAADDLVQDTMLRAWRSRASFTPGTNLEAWTFTILRNVFYSAWRKVRPEVQDEYGTYTERLVALPEQDGHLDLADVRSALATLTAPMREALLLVAVEDLTYEEAAAVMNCRIGTVKSRVWRARDQLARALGYGGAEIGQDSLILSTISGSIA